MLQLYSDHLPDIVLDIIYLIGRKVWRSLCQDATRSPVALKHSSVKVPFLVSCSNSIDS